MEKHSVCLYFLIFFKLFLYEGDFVAYGDPSYAEARVGVVVGFMRSGKVRIDPCFMPNRFTRDKNTEPVICEYDSNYKGRNFREPHTIAIMNTDNVKLVDTSKVDDEDDVES